MQFSTMQKSFDRSSRSRPLLKAVTSDEISESVAVSLSPNAENLDLLARVPPVAEFIVGGEKKCLDVAIIAHVLFGEEEL